MTDRTEPCAGEQADSLDPNLLSLGRRVNHTRSCGFTLAQAAELLGVDPDVAWVAAVRSLQADARRARQENRA